MQMVPMEMIRHLARVASDHYPIVFSFDEVPQFQHKLFRFEDTWKSYPATWSIVTKAWEKNDFGDASDILNRKIHRTMKALYYWNKNECKSLCLLKDELKEDIFKLQLEEDLEGGLCYEKMNLLRSKVHELNVTLSRLFTWWYQRAKASWNEEGDTNSKFFHDYAFTRRNGKLIRQIKDEINNMEEDLD
ncbi:uncharacterized protein LOC110096000 [Dendrobium catenatum]|uniref:uncharacterized protein LOC110096000 n=1 Tax=Dendrobium catenatum TaxID=906689 RepID=UPI0009F31033|nr:uncharacterized protein LOC110096000 [Dendrobium catenatum]